MAFLCLLAPQPLHATNGFTAKRPSSHRNDPGLRKLALLAIFNISDTIGVHTERSEGKDHTTYPHGCGVQLNARQTESVCSISQNLNISGWVYLYMFYRRTQPQRVTVLPNTSCPPRE